MREAIVTPTGVYNISRMLSKTNKYVAAFTVDMAFIYPFVRHDETLTGAILIGTSEGKHQTQNLIKYSTAIKPNYINLCIVNAAT